MIRHFCCRTIDFVTNMYNDNVSVVLNVILIINKYLLYLHVMCKYSTIDIRVQARRTVGKMPKRWTSCLGDQHRVTR